MATKGSRGNRVVVVGAGMAGFVAAVQALELGADVVLLEKGASPGGSMAMSGGSIWCPKSYEDLRFLVPRGDPALARTLVEGYMDGIHWLESIGAPINSTTAAPYRGIDRHCYQMDPDPAPFVSHMLGRLESEGAKLMVNTAGSRVILDDAGAVSGVIADTPEGRVRLHADSLVLATGGFQGNPEMTARYFGRWSDRLILRANPHSTGDGFMMGTAAGGASSQAMSTFYGHLMPAPPARVPRDFFVGYTQYYSDQVVLVNLRGERFVDESSCDETNAQAVAREPEALAFMIFDGEVHRNHAFRSFGEGAPDYDVFERSRAVGALATTASTVEELAEELQAAGVYGRGVLETVRGYNEAIMAGRGPQLRVPRSDHPNPIVTPPFYALAVTPGVTITYGGLRINTDGQVMGFSGRPIPGLYAAGADAGGIHNEHYGGGLCLGLVFGRQAARHAVARLQS